MAEIKHTPGPWTVVREEDAYAGEFEGASLPFVTNIGPFHIEWHDALNTNNADLIEADIALFSAAPDLLEAVEAMLEWDAREEDHAVGFRDRLALCAAAFDKARAAHAKATGEQS